ncbi:MAG: [NiFe]-hydrogenase assembly chaperone HybE [Ancalomicrobiaceae bacterium]|nr:[NiFe]-hydrogenase assembly chaperone HybE [Ancalomicrobiaceae bacterium]
MTAEAGPDLLDRDTLDLTGFLRAHWLDVALRMADLPICNAALGVHVTGFRRAGDWRIGIVVTQWFMNVVAVPDAGVALPGIGSKLALQLPAGEVEGIVGAIDGLGRVATASLYSPMQAFDAADAAIAVAEAALVQLFTTPEPAPPPRQPIALNRRALLFPAARLVARP